MSDALNDANEFGGTQTLVQCLTLHQIWWGTDTCSVFDTAPNVTGGGTATFYLGGPEFKSRPADQIF